VDAIEFYIEHFNETQLTKGNDEKQWEFVTEERLQQIISERDRKMPEIICEQLIRMIGNNLVLANMVGANQTGSSVSGLTTPNGNVETENTDTKFVEDEALLSDVMKWS
jgi:hypothetical protein